MMIAVCGRLNVLQTKIDFRNGVVMFSRIAHHFYLRINKTASLLSPNVKCIARNAHDVFKEIPQQKYLI